MLCLIDELTIFAHRISSAEAQASKKTLVKTRAHSSDSISHVAEVCECAPIEAIKIEGNTRAKKSSSATPEISAIKHYQPKPVSSETSSKLVKDISCQFPEEQLTTVDEEIQCCEQKTLAGQTTPNTIVYSCCPECTKKNNSGNAADAPQVIL